MVFKPGISPNHKQNVLNCVNSNREANELFQPDNKITGKDQNKRLLLRLLMVMRLFQSQQVVISVETEMIIEEKDINLAQQISETRCVTHLNIHGPFSLTVQFSVGFTSSLFLYQSNRMTKLRSLLFITRFYNISGGT